MKKKGLIIGIILILIILISGGILYSKSAKGSEDASRFKEEYESLNGQTNKNGNAYRNVSIASDNPFVYITTEDLIAKIANGETFYVYFGSKLCPWCRSVIEMAIEVANDSFIDTIYYVDIWDDDGNEILRDKYALEDGVPTLISDASVDYYTLLKTFDNLLKDYTLTNEDGEKLEVGEKRIYAPSFIYVKKGIAEKLTDGISSKQTSSLEELTDEIRKEEKELFQEFFTN